MEWLSCFKRRKKMRSCSTQVDNLCLQSMVQESQAKFINLSVDHLKPRLTDDMLCKEKLKSFRISGGNDPTVNVEGEEIHLKKQIVDITSGKEGHVNTAGELKKQSVVILSKADSNCSTEDIDLVVHLKRPAKSKMRMAEAKQTSASNHVPHSDTLNILRVKIPDIPTQHNGSVGNEYEYPKSREGAIYPQSAHENPISPEIPHSETLNIDRVNIPEKPPTQYNGFVGNEYVCTKSRKCAISPLSGSEYAILPEMSRSETLNIDTANIPGKTPIQNNEFVGNEYVCIKSRECALSPNSAREYPEMSHFGTKNVARGRTTDKRIHHSGSVGNEYVCNKSREYAMSSHPTRRRAENHNAMKPRSKCHVCRCAHTNNNQKTKSKIVHQQKAHGGSNHQFCSLNADQYKAVLSAVLKLINKLNEYPCSNSLNEETQMHTSSLEHEIEISGLEHETEMISRSKSTLPNKDTTNCKCFHHGRRVSGSQQGIASSLNEEQRKAISEFLKVMKVYNVSSVNETPLVCHEQEKCLNVPGKQTRKSPHKCTDKMKSNCLYHSRGCGSESVTCPCKKCKARFTGGSDENKMKCKSSLEKEAECCVSKRALKEKDTKNCKLCHHKLSGSQGEVCSLNVERCPAMSSSIKELKTKLNTLNICPENEIPPNNKPLLQRVVDLNEKHKIKMKKNRTKSKQMHSNRVCGSENVNCSLQDKQSKPAMLAGAKLKKKCNKCPIHGCSPSKTLLNKSPGSQGLVCSLNDDQCKEAVPEVAKKLNDYNICSANKILPKCKSVLEQDADLRQKLTLKTAFREKDKTNPKKLYSSKLCGSESVTFPLLAKQSQRFLLAGTKKNTNKSNKTCPVSQNKNPSGKCSKQRYNSISNKNPLFNSNQNFSTLHSNKTTKRTPNLDSLPSKTFSPSLDRTSVFQFFDFFNYADQNKKDFCTTNGNVPSPKSVNDKCQEKEGCLCKRCKKISLRGGDNTTDNRRLVTKQACDKCYVNQSSSLRCVEKSTCVKQMGNKSSDCLFSTSSGSCSSKKLQGIAYWCIEDSVKVADPKMCH